MGRLLWDRRDAPEDGVDHGAVYIPGHSAAWNGLVSVDEAPVGGDQAAVYFDGVKTIDMIGAEDFSLQIAAYTYPVEIENYERDLQEFQFTYRTNKAKGHLQHLVYRSSIFSETVGRKTLTNTADPAVMTWTLYASPVDVPHAKPTAHLVIDTTVADPRAMAEFEAIVYGSASAAPRFPDPAEVIAIFAGYATLVVVDHGDGTWTATGPPEAIQMLDSTTFQISWPSAVYIDDESYKISTL